MTDLKFQGFISASQIDAFQECARRWHAHYVEGEPREPETDATARGTRVHKILELYDKEGRKIDATTDDGLIAQQAEPYLFTPKSGLAEFEFNLDSVGVNSPVWWTYTGKIDYLKENGRYVRDYKTTSDFKYAKPIEVLQVDPQAILYGSVALELQGTEKEPVDFSWLYLRTKKPKALERTFTLPAYDISRERDNLDAFVENEMLPTRKLPLLSLPPNPKACFKYGKPCPYKHRCTDLTGLALLKGSISSMATPPLERADIMARLKNGTLGGSTAPAPAPQQSLPNLANLPKLNPAGVTKPLPPEPELAEDQDEGVIENEEDALIPNVNPIDLLGQHLQIPRNPGEADVDYMLRLTKAQAAKEGISTEKRGPGRPPGAKNKATLEKEAKAAQEAEADRLVKEAEEKALAEKAQEKAKYREEKKAEMSVKGHEGEFPEGPGKTLEDQPVDTKDGISLEGTCFPCLYVNCLPVGRDVLDFSYVVREANLVIEKELGVPHYSLIDYGKGKGAFLMAVEKILKDELETSFPRAIYLDTRNSEGADCLNLLVSMSAKQVRGVR